MVRRRPQGPALPTLSLSLRIQEFSTLILAYMLDSLVRVSRRVGDTNFVSISNATYGFPGPSTPLPRQAQLLSSARPAPKPGGYLARRRALNVPRSAQRYLTVVYKFLSVKWKPRRSTTQATLTDRYSPAAANRC